VGKTALAGATALWLAGQGRRTLLASTNPVHSLSGLLEKSVLGAPTVVAENFWAYEIDTKETIERSKKDIREKIQWFLKFADISTKADDFVESATMNPAFEESAMFENMEALPIAIISRFIGWFQDFGIPVGGVIVNFLLDNEALGQDCPEFVLNRVRM
jgi:anion-transporting  ArsA/GET3 family ATPase